MARLLQSRLHSQGCEVWVDWEKVRPSECWRRAVFSAIEVASALYFLATPTSLSSRNCRWELHYAMRMKKIVCVIPGDWLPWSDSRSYADEVVP